MTRRNRISPFPALLLLLAAGCGGAQEANLSTVSTSDPARFEKAQAESRAAAEAARQAEARAVPGALKGIEEP